MALLQTTICLRISTIIFFLIFLLSEKSHCIRVPNRIVEPLKTTSSHQSLKTAVFALGSFWRSEAVFGCLDGVVRTTVGYAGGTKHNPEYRSLGDHAESVRVCALTFSFLLLSISFLFSFLLLNFHFSFCEFSGLYISDGVADVIISVDPVCTFARIVCIPFQYCFAFSIGFIVLEFSLCEAVMRFECPDIWWYVEFVCRRSLMCKWIESSFLFFRRLVSALDRNY